MDALVFAGAGRLAAISLILIVLALVALGALTVPAGVRGPRPLGVWLESLARQRQAVDEQKVGKAKEAVRYASEIAVALQGATATAERRRAQCQQVQQKVERAWQAHRTADSALDRLRRASVFATATYEVPDAERVRSLRLEAGSAGAQAEAALPALRRVPAAA
jgi:hypothetical protein